MPGVDIFDRAELETSVLSGKSYIFNSPVEFSEFVETSAVEKGVTNTDMLLNICEIEDIEYESLSDMLTQHLKDKIRIEMEDEGLLPKRSRLDFF